ncbi:MAG TPA: outer membrane protein assembly factor BamD [Bacteroidales bacterium]|nr:outer membrane protein assembly factor BamD [Bacteroidales bacterium]
MFKLNVRNILILLVIVALANSCGEYSKLVKSSDYELKYTKAIEYYEAGEYYKAQALFEDLKGIYRATDKAQKVAYYTAYCSYGLGEYSLAAYLFKDFVRIYPASEHAEEVSFVAAYCYYLNSPEISLDQTFTKAAIAELQFFIEKYPNSEKREEAEKHIDELQIKLETKAFNNAMLFYNIMDYKAATTALRNVLKDFPDTKYREEIMFTIMKANYLLAENSIVEKQYERYQDTIEDYYAFVDKFPNSKKIKEAEKIFTNSVKFIESKNGL